jgi:hypothetical protein
MQENLSTLQYALIYTAAAVLLLVGQQSKCQINAQAHAICCRTKLCMKYSECVLSAKLHLTVRNLLESVTRKPASTHKIHTRQETTTCFDQYADMQHPRSTR